MGRAAFGFRANLPVAEDAAHVSLLGEVGVQWGRTHRWECDGLIECQAAADLPPTTTRGSVGVDGFLGVHGDYDAHPIVTPYVYIGAGVMLANSAILARNQEAAQSVESNDAGIFPDVIGMAGFGADFKVGPGRFRLGTMMPFGASEHGLGPSITASVGVIGGRTDDGAEPAAAE